MEPAERDAVAVDAAHDRQALEAGLEKSRRGFGARLHGLLAGGTTDEETWEAVEEALIRADVGAQLALELVDRARQRFAPGGPEAAIRAELSGLFAPREAVGWPRKPSPEVPAVVLVIGVNGTGKTTTIAKLAHRFKARGARVLLAAADTFRAAAIEQLGIWAKRVDVPLVVHKAGADPAAVVYDALDAAVARRSDVVIVDTAGRLHTKANLMEELAKIQRTVERRLPAAQPESLFVLDATTGQNGLAQAKAFHAAAPLTGIALTKLDSTAKGGIIFAIERTLGVPVRFVGVGEKLEDLVEFDPDAFVAALLG
ncbi:MAG TPA: signal recognition particle-docking protein FtsY [Candidatus Limnocylindrales bacterium]|nr:signal recognition particle-docking protein FtsY [Candidatus Limnocylindrales bacterium]